MSRHMFPGGNTPNGFHSFFDQIISERDSRKIIYLKGSSGSGKSTFMKKIGAHFEALGDTVEYMHCSNDITSLDGVCVKNLKISVVDGTAPHPGDPQIPVAIGEILNLAEFIDDTEVSSSKNELKSMLDEKNILLGIASGFYKAAHEIYKTNEFILDKILNKQRIDEIAIDMLKAILFNSNGASGGKGQNRKLFASAVTPFGLENFIGNILNTEKIYVFKGSIGIGAVLSMFQEFANLKGLDTESFYCPINPQKIEHLIIPELGMSFSTSNRYHNPTLNAYARIDFDDFLDKNLLKKYKDEIEFNEQGFENMLNKAMNMFKSSKMIHDNVEKIYTSHIDFNGLDALCEKTINQLEEARKY